jgi:predicted aminopeptidase
LLFLVSEESSDYYVHLARGQLHVLLETQPLDQALHTADLDSVERDRLNLIPAITAFAIDSLGLHASTNYTRLHDTGGSPISWNVSASPPDSFTPYLWNFPFIGALPYKGFFTQNRAIAERRHLEQLGYDAIDRPVPAYSTLGYFSDPILSTMLNYSAARLADLVLHELTHATIFASGNTDFNESLATFIGREGSLLFLAHHYGVDTPLIIQAQEARADQKIFAGFMRQVTSALDSLYNSDLERSAILAQRHQVYAVAKEGFHRIQPQFKRLNYDGFLSWELNNARLLSYRRYNRDLSLFAQVFDSRQGNMRLTLEVFSACSSAREPWACLSKAIQSQPVPQ